MRFGLLGDIHGNFDALLAVLYALEKEKVDEVFCLGDIVGYGAEPAKCIEVLRQIECVSVAGNHDYAVAEKTEIEYFNPTAREAVIWTRNNISEEDKDFLASLPLVDERHHLSLVHSTLHFPECFGYIFTSYDAELCFKALGNSVCFVGHSHIPMAIFRGNILQCSEGPVIDLKDIPKAIVNIGSVGQPRDRNPKATYVVYDQEEEIVRIKRVEYDVKSAVKKIINAGLPKANAERLLWGV